MEHSFDIKIAERIGINAAIILKHLYFWVAKNTADEKHFHDGRYWTYSSVKAMCELFPYLSKKQISGALEKLESFGLVMVGNYNSTPYDRTRWFTITESGYELLNTKGNAREDERFDSNSQNENSISQKGKCNNNTIEYSTTDTLPDIKPYIENNKVLNTDVFNCEKPKVSHDDVQRITDAWNSLSDIGITPISRMSSSSQRYKWTTARLREHGIENVLKAIANVRNSSWLRSGKFNFSYDWFIRPNNFVKVLDGNYLDRDFNPKHKYEPEPDFMNPPETFEEPEGEWLN